MQEALLAIRDAHCRINSGRVLRVDNLALYPGQHWCFYGGNGAGKSLLASLISGQLYSGREAVHYGKGFDPARDIMSLSFEEQRRLHELDVRHDISEYAADALDQGTTLRALITAGTKKAGSDEAFGELVRALALDSLLDKGLRFLSSGQLRRAMLARALYRNPPLLILDEPLESIDRDTRPLLIELLQSVMGRQNTTLHLCRREEDILPGLTHMLLLDELTVIEQGDIATVMAGEHFRRIRHHSVPVPDQLPDCGYSGNRSADAPEDTDPESGSSEVPLIELRGVSAAWQQNQVFSDLHWVFRRGQHALIEGPNGCGKSTLLGMIDGQNHKAYGQAVYLFGRRRGSGESVWDIKSRFGVVSNELHNRYVKGWRVLEVVVSGFYDSEGLYDDSGATQQNCARQWLEALGLQGLERSHYHELSFGQQRLVLLARAMVKQPAILILDEPCVGLDDASRDLILGLLDRIADSTPTQLIYVSHTSGEHPRCINQFLRFVPDESFTPGSSQQDAQDCVSTRSRSRYRLEIH